MYDGGLRPNDTILFVVESGGRLEGYFNPFNQTTQNFNAMFGFSKILKKNNYFAIKK